MYKDIVWFASVLAEKHSMKSVQSWSFSGPLFPAFRLNTDIYKVNFRIQYVCGKIQTRKTPNSDNYGPVKTSAVLLNSKKDRNIFNDKRRENY